MKIYSMNAIMHSGFIHYLLTKSSVSKYKAADVKYYVSLPPQHIVSEYY